MRFNYCLRLFSFFFFATYPLCAVTTFKNAVQSLGAGGNGAAVARELVQVANLMSERLTYDAKAERFFEFLNGALEDFDFARIYESEWLKPANDGFRSLVLMGENTGHNYRVSVARANVDNKNFGNARAEYRMRQNQIGSDKTYTTQLEFDAALKRLDAQAMARLLETSLKVTDADNIQNLKSPAVNFFPEITGPPRKLIHQAAADFPRTTNFISKYLQLRSLAETRTAQGKNYTDFSLRAHINLDALADDYPQLKKFFKDLRNLFIWQLYLANNKGHNIFSFIINTQTEEIYLGFKTRGGKLLPWKSDGSPVFNEAFTLTGTTDQKFYMAFNLFVNVYGLKINTGNIGAYLRYQANNEKMSFFAKLTKMPEGKISGALFGVLPTWLIDMSIPSDLQTLMNKFSQTAFNANNGEGSRAEIAWRKRGGQATLHASASTEFLDNRFIRIGMKIWVRRFRPNEKVQEDLRIFFGRFTRAILDDLATM